ncbi:MAG: sulfur carrier protein ThiS [Prevotellaceae bacterium]|jgi:thiamine biosynthesis protein ThiS|nr:sulfur carrier protein ThiS [Prevotellaceae bacterium]
MVVFLNDKPYEVAEGTTLAAFIESLGLKHEGMAVAFDYEAIPKSMWSEVVLFDRMELLFVQAMSGG